MRKINFICLMFLLIIGCDSPTTEITGTFVPDYTLLNNIKKRDSIIGNIAYEYIKKNDSIPFKIDIAYMDIQHLNNYRNKSNTRDILFKIKNVSNKKIFLDNLFPSLQIVIKQKTGNSYSDFSKEFIQSMVLPGFQFNLTKMNLLQNTAKNVTDMSSFNISIFNYSCRNFYNFQQDFMILMDPSDEYYENLPLDYSFEKGDYIAFFVYFPNELCPFTHEGYKKCEFPESIDEYIHYNKIFFSDTLFFKIL